MDKIDNPVSLSATQSNPSAEEEEKEESLSQWKNNSSGISSSSSSSAAAALPIRAPLSFDSDIAKINGSSNSLKVASIGFLGTDSDITSDEEDDGFVSGEDEFGITPYRKFIADPDEKTIDKVDGKVFVPPKALLSVDDDEDDEGFVSGMDDDEEVSDVSNVVASVIKIPLVESSMPPPKALVSGEDDVVVDKVDSEVSSIAVVPSVSAAEPSEETKVTEENISPEGVVSSCVETFVPVVTEAPKESLVVNVEDTPKEEVKESKHVDAAEKKIDVPESVIETKDSPEVKENGGSDGKEVQNLSRESVGLDSGDNQSGVEELVKSVFPVEVKDKNASNAADSNAEMKQPVLVELEKTVVEVEEDEKVSEPKIVEISVDKDVSLGSQSEQAAVVVDEPVEPKLVEDTADAPSSLERGEKEKDAEKIAEGIDRSVSIVPEELKPESETGSLAKPDECVVDGGSDGIESKASAGVNGLTETQTVDSIAVPAESSSAAEWKHRDNGIESAPIAVEILAEKDDSLGNKSEQASLIVEEPVEPKLVEDTTVAVSDAQSSVETGEKEKDDDEEKSAGGIEGRVSRVPVELKSEPETGARAKPDGHMVDESKTDVAVNGLTETPVVDSITVPAESKCVIESNHLDKGIQLENAISSDTTQSTESAVPRSVLELEGNQETEDEVEPEPDYTEEDEDSASDEGNEGLMLDGSETAKQIMKELERASGSHSGWDISRDSFQRIDGQIVMDSDEEVDTDEEGDGKELFDSAALAALLKAATGAGPDGGNVTITAPDGSRLFSMERPAGLGSSIRSLKPAPRTTRPNLLSPSDLTAGESENELSEEEKKKLEKIQQIRVKFLRLVQRLGQSPEESVAAQVLYRLLLAAGRQTSQTFSLDAARKTAAELEAEGKDDLDFSLNILVLGKTGVGKSATINSIFGEKMAHIDPFEPGTTQVKEIVGKVDGVTIRVFDTPGLKSSVMEQAFNQKVLASVKKLTKKNPLDILLYVDRLDTQTRDLNDMPLLRSITATLGSAIWRSAIVTLTHAASAPPDGSSGHPLSYNTFVGQRSHIVQQSVGQAVGDLRMMNPSLMNPVSLVENHPSCRTNREGQRVLPNGQTWKPQLLLLCYSMKILSEASSLSKPQDAFDHRKLFGFRVRAPPLPYMLSTMLQSRAHPKLPSDQGIDNGDSDIELGDMSDSDQEEDEYDQLPPFKPLRKSQIAKLSKEQRKAYFDEYDYRVKLLQKKQLREELIRMREMKKRKDSPVSGGFMGEDADQENDGPAAVPVPLPDMVLPPSFDGDNPAYRYRFLEPTSQLLARPVLDNHGWDHDCGYDGVSLEESRSIMSKFPGVVAVQITKDKKEFNIHLDSSIAAKYGENGSTLAGFDIQTIGKQLGYIVRGETKFKNFKKNKTAAGVAITFLGETVATGLKVEDQIAIGKRLSLVGSTGTVRSQGEAAYGANIEVRLKEKDFPIGQDQSTLGLSLMKWRGDLAVGGNFQSQISVGRSSKVSVRVGLNNKLSGQMTVRTSSSEQLQLALVGLLPIAVSIYRTIFPGAPGDTYSAY